jgi:hypothetical protein
MIIDWIVTGAGAVLAALVLRDMFHTLWHPSGQGGFATLVVRTVWRVTQRQRRGGSGLSGSLALLLVVLGWASLLVLGFALVYWAHMPEGFVHSSGLDVSERSEFLDSVYLSMVTLTTLGYGDVVPVEGWLRIVGPLEAFSGFALLTAAVSWAMQIYPVLSRRRSLALRLALLGRAGSEQAVSAQDSPVPATLLHQLAADLTQLRVDAQQYSETVYFRETDRTLSLADQLDSGLRLARAAGRSPREDVRWSGRALEAAIDDLARVLAAHFGTDDGDTDAVVRAFGRAHWPD